MPLPAIHDSRNAKVIALIGSGHFLSHFYIFALLPLFPLLKQDFNVSYTAVGLFATVFNAASGLLQLPIGVLVDRLGPVNILIMGIIIEAVCFLCIGYFALYHVCLFFIALAGAANAVYHPADYAILSANVDNDRMGRAFSLHTFCGYAGGATAPVVMVGIATIWNWQTACLLAGAFGLLIAAFLLAGRRILVQAADTSAHSGAKRGRARAAGTVGLFALLTAPPILFCFGFFALIAMSASGVNSFSVAALVELYQHPLSLASTALTVFLATSAGGILIGGIIADRTVKHEQVAMIGFTGAALAMILVGSVYLPISILIAVLAIAGLMYGMIMPSRDMLVRRVTPPERTGTVFAFVSVGLNVGAAGMPLLFGWIMDYGDPRFVFWTAAGIMLLALIVAGRTAKLQRS